MKFFKYIFTLIVIVTTHNVTAQVYPVQVTVATTPPYYNYLSHYGDQNNHLLVVATLTDFNSPPINVRLRLKIEGAGYTLQTRQDVPVGNVYTLSPGSPVFIQGDELLPLLSEQNLAVLNGSPNLNNLSEGITTICVEIVENGTGGAILSTSNCTSFLLQLMQPPQAFLPVCNSVVDTASMFQTFQWSQPQNYIPSIGSELNYTFSLYEWIDTNNFNIFQTGQGLVYTTQTTSPIVQVSNFDVAFQNGRKYVWRVRAQLNSNGIPTQMITQNGLSQPCSFYYGKPITIQEALADGLSINLTAQALTTRKGQAIWTVTDETPGQGLSTYSSYIVEYRKKASEGSSIIYPWSVDTVVNLQLPIYQLEPEQTYQVRVAGMSGSYTSDRTPISEFTTPSSRDYTCGEADLPYLPSNYQPLSNLHVGDVVQIGQFSLNVTQATSLGVPGRYSGYGEIPHDFIGGAKVKVRFDNLLIDREYVVREGVANAMTDGAEGWMNDYYLDHAFRDTVGFVTAYGYSGDSTSIFVVVDGDTLSYTFDLPYPIVIYGEGNIAYQFWPDGTVIITTWGTTPSTDQLDATKNFFARFEASEGAEQLFDKKQFDHFAANYEVIQCAENFNYWVPNTAKGVTGTTQVKVTVHVNTVGYTSSSINFEVKGGYTAVPHSVINDTTFLLTLPAKSYSYQVYALYDEFKIGKLNVINYDSVSRKVRIVPLVPLENLSVASIKQGLANQFKASKIGFDVIIDSLYSTAEFNAQTVFTSPDATLMSKYTAQMQSLREAFINDREFNSDEYLIFVVPNFENSTIDGYMVRGKALGFLTQSSTSNIEDFIHTLAHELGHGMGGLQHSWGTDASKKGATSNLMDYSSTSTKTLTRLQWDALNNSPTVLSLFDDEEDSESQSVTTIKFQKLGLPGLTQNFVWITKLDIGYNDVYRTSNDALFTFTQEQKNSIDRIGLTNGIIDRIDIGGVTYHIVTEKIVTEIASPEENTYLIYRYPTVVFYDPLKDHHNYSVLSTEGDTVPILKIIEDDILILGDQLRSCKDSVSYLVGYSNNVKQYVLATCPEEQEGVSCDSEYHEAIIEAEKQKVKQLLTSIVNASKGNSNYSPFKASNSDAFLNFIDGTDLLIIKDKVNTLARYRPEKVVAYIFIESTENKIYNNEDMLSIAQFAVSQVSAANPSKEIALHFIYSAKFHAGGTYHPATSCVNETFCVSSSSMIQSGLLPTDIPATERINDGMLWFFSKLYKPFIRFGVYTKYDGSIAYTYKEQVASKNQDVFGLPYVHGAFHLVSKYRDENISYYQSLNNNLGIPQEMDETDEQYEQFITPMVDAFRQEWFAKIERWKQETLDNPMYWQEGDISFDQLKESMMNATVVMEEFKKQTKLELLKDATILVNGSYNGLTPDHYYEFDVASRIIDPIVYGGLDILGCIPGIDYLADGLGFIYSTARCNSSNMIVYSAALATPFVGALVYKTGTKFISYFVKKEGAFYSLEAKLITENTEGFVKVSDDFPVIDGNVSDAKTALNSPENINIVSQQRRKVAYKAGQNVVRFVAKSGGELSTHLNSIVNLPLGKSYSGDVYRSLSVSSETNFGALPNQMTDQYIYSSWGRYDLNGEENAMYMSKTIIGNQTELVPHYGSWSDFSTYKFTNVQVDNLLDLSDDAIRERLGTEFDQLIIIAENKQDMYEFTNVIASWARQKGYNGIIAPGARGAKNYQNVILFSQAYIDQILMGKTALKIIK